jgi:hypothetical protein
MINVNPKLRISSKKLVKILSKKSKSARIITLGSACNPKQLKPNKFKFRKSNTVCDKNILNLRSNKFKINFQRNSNFKSVRSKEKISQFWSKHIASNSHSLSKSNTNLFQKPKKINIKSEFSFSLKCKFDWEKRRSPYFDIYDSDRKSVSRRKHKEQQASKFKKSDLKLEICSTHLTNKKKSPDADHVR